MLWRNNLIVSGGDCWPLREKFFLNSSISSRWSMLYTNALTDLLFHLKCTSVSVYLIGLVYRSGGRNALMHVICYHQFYSWRKTSLASTHPQWYAGQNKEVQPPVSVSVIQSTRVQWLLIPLDTARLLIGIIKSPPFSMWSKNTIV